MTKAPHRPKGLAAIDPRAVPLVHGSEVTTLRALPDPAGRRDIPMGSVGRVTGLPGDDRVTVRLVGRGEFTVARHDVAPRNDGQLRYALSREATERALGPCAIYQATVGSRAWGLADEGSDHDTRGVVLWPFAWSVARGRVPDVFTSADGSHSWWELGRTIRQALRADPNTLEALFVPDYRATDEIGDALRDARQCFVSQEIYGSFGRYALAQSAKLTKSLRLAEHRALVLDWLAADPSQTLDAVAARLAEAAMSVSDAAAQLQAKQYLKQLYGSMHDQGLIASRSFDGLVALARDGGADLDLPRELRPKNAYNLLRIASCAVTWLQTGAPLIETTGELREQLLAIKQGAVDLATALRWTDAVSDQLEAARASSVLPKAPDFAAADRLLLRAREVAADRWLRGADGPWGKDAAPPPAPIDERRAQ
ncbi:MAG: nucleotidyltransferase domain-containing protein [Myxococcota bacterium]